MGGLVAREYHRGVLIAGGDQQVLVGDMETYEARCRRCFNSSEGAVEADRAHAS